MAVPAAEANRHFSRLLRGVREGRTYVVTSHGRPVARMTPVDSETPTAPAARAALFERLDSQRIARIGRWTRDELYKR